MKITVLGPGIIGSGLTANAAMNGNDVTLYGRRPFDQVCDKLKGVFNTLCEVGVLTHEDAEKYYHSIKYTSNLEEACIDADLVQECLAENIDLKKDVYRRIQAACGEKQPVIASATSSKFPSILSEGALYPEKIICGHPYNPSYLLPLIEVCGPEASQETIDTAVRAYKSMGKYPVICRKEAKGFIVNKVSWAAMAAAKEVVEEGVCSVEDMDRAIMYGPGLRMAVTGQLLTMSLGVAGGFREYEKKYSGKEEASAPYIALAEGIDEELANRSEEEGRTTEAAEKYRDKMFAAILKLEGLL